MDGNSNRGSQTSNVVTRQRAVASEQRVLVGGPAATSGAAPQVTPFVEDGVVRAVDLQCSCGCRVRLVLEYSATQFAAPHAAAAPPQPTETATPSRVASALATRSTGGGAAERAVG